MKSYTIAGLLALVISTAIFSSCSKPCDLIKNKTWEGQIYRMDDEKLLSDVLLKMTYDTLYLYANAIFGAENDTLLFHEYDKKDSIFTYQSLNGDLFSFRFRHKLRDGNEMLYFFSSDYFIVLGPSQSEIADEGALDFYTNRAVPKEGYLYLDGAYEGRLEMENEFANLMLMGMGGATVKLVFMDDFKVKVYFKNLLVNIFSGSMEPTYEIVEYVIAGNRLILNPNKSHAQSIEVRDYGEILVMATDNENIVLYKIY